MSERWLSTRKHLSQNMITGSDSVATSEWLDLFGVKALRKEVNVCREIIFVKKCAVFQWD